MQDNRKPTRPSRQAVLIVSYADGHLETFADGNVDVHFTRVPAAFSVEAEQQAEQIMDWMLPKRFQDLYRADKLRKTGTTLPLLPSVLRDSIVTSSLLKVLDRVPGIMSTAAALPDESPVVDHEAALRRERSPTT